MQSKMFTCGVSGFSGFRVYPGKLACRDEPHVSMSSKQSVRLKGSLLHSSFPGAITGDGRDRLASLLYCTVLYCTVL